VVIDLFNLYRLAVDSPMSGRYGTCRTSCVIVKFHVIIPEENVIDGEGGTVRPLDPFSYSGDGGFSVIGELKTFCQIKLNTFRRVGTFIAHKIIIEGFDRSLSLYNITRESPAYGTAVSANLFERDNDKRIFR